MRIVILGLNHAPEPVGIGPYTAELAAWLAAAGHDVEVVTAKPYYPTWRRTPGYPRGYARTVENGVAITRCPLYVPAEPTGGRRILHHLSFALTALPAMLRASFRRRPDLVLTIAPSLAAVPVARLCAALRGVPAWLHIQDFEVGAAIATGLIAPGSLTGRLAAAFERAAYAGFAIVSTISPQMCARLAAAGVPAARIVELRNWADTAAIVPLDHASAYRALWGITTPHVALYSGNIANKQGVEIVLDAAHRLRSRTDLTFVICADGARVERLALEAGDLPNIRFHPLQPRDRLGELLGLATIHLLPQVAGAADLVLPSKLTNMLASGRPVVATALPGTGLADEVTGCGAIVPPGDAAAFAEAITTLIDDPAAHARAAAEARRRAEERWSKRAILARLEARMIELVGAQG